MAQKKSPTLSGTFYTDMHSSGIRFLRYPLDLEYIELSES